MHGEGLMTPKAAPHCLLLIGVLALAGQAFFAVPNALSSQPEELSAARAEAAKNPRNPAAQKQLALVALKYHLETEARKAAHEAMAVAPDDADAKALVAI